MDQGIPHKTRHTETNRKVMGKSIEHMCTGENFLNRTPIAYALRSRIGKWRIIKLQSFCKAKDTVKGTKCQSTNWEKKSSPTLQDKMATNKLGKNLHQPYIRQRANIQYTQRTQEVRLQRAK